MMIEKFPSGPLSTNAIVVACGKTRRAALVDPAPESSEELVEFLQDHDLTPSVILLTHSHWDHIADVYALKSKYDVPVLVHASDAENLRNPGSDGIPLFFPIHGVEPSGFLEEGQQIRLGEWTIFVLHTPGHTPGSVCFYIPNHHTLLSGDTLFQGSIGRLDLPTGRPQSMWGSLRKLAALPPETRVVPGHGEDTSIGEESWLSRAQEIFEGE